MNIFYLYIIRNIKKGTIDLNEEELETLIAVFNNGIVDENKRNPLWVCHGKMWELWTWWTIKLNSYSLSILAPFINLNDLNPALSTFLAELEEDRSSQDI